MLNIGLIGNGTIAKSLATFCGASPDRYRIVGALATSRSQPSVGAHLLVRDLPSLLAQKPDLIVECAGHAAGAAHAVAVLEAGVGLIVMSTGCFADKALWDAARAASVRSGARLTLPAGAAPGIDALAAAKLAGLSEVRLTSIKPPAAWAGTFAETRCKLGDVAVETILFRGDAREAAIMFPKNANVAATVALAGIGFEKTSVAIIADPRCERNVHRVEAFGAFGEMRVEVRANASPGNPKTSYLAALSVMRVLENKAQGIEI